MKLPDLGRYDDAGVVEYHGHPEAIAAAAQHAKLRYLNVDLGQALDKATLFHELAKGLKLPEHFGNNFDGVADSLEDREWIGKNGCLIRLAHATHYRKTHPNDWGTLEEILSEASTFWRERQRAFWVLIN
jgi:hypothetical protein